MLTLTSEQTNMSFKLESSHQRRPPLIRYHQHNNWPFIAITDTQRILDLLPSPNQTQFCSSSPQEPSNEARKASRTLLCVHWPSPEIARGTVLTVVSQQTRLGTRTSFSKFLPSSSLASPSPSRMYYDNEPNGDLPTGFPPLVARCCRHMHACMFCLCLLSLVRAAGGAA